MEQSFDRPIPGMGMTFEVGSRPWQTPPELTTVEQATDYYVERMGSDQFKAQLADVMEMGVPLTTLANTIQLASVMEGIHSVDIGMLLIPIIVEIMITIADSQGVKYQTGMENMNTERPTAIARIITDKMKEQDIPQEEMPMADMIEPKAEEEAEVKEQRQVRTAGLMARRT